jgi:TusA-related sulfurtransferase
MSDEREAVDVRDMLCAQALAQVDGAMRRLASEATLPVIANAADVLRDLAVWAQERGHVVAAAELRDGETWLRIRKRKAG